MSSFSSDFDVDIDEDDLRQIDLAEQEALSTLQQPPESSSFAAPSLLPSSFHSNGTPQSPSLIQKSSFGAKITASPSRSLPWAQPSSSLGNRNPGQQVKGRSRADEPPTHHHIDKEAAKTWIYPTNVSFREYQFNIVQRALFDNILVSLPTGLGKTFIAATIMFNYYRWFPKSKIVFVAPTKPLVAQQVEACFKICGVPYSHTAQLTGTVMKPQRALAYEERRVFYMTPQTLSNDLKSGLCDPKSIVCLVIDEAHRGTGNYAYGECVSLIRKKNPSVRILALSATPGATVEAVQNVINALCIARVEIRIEESIDLRPYLHKRRTDLITLPLGDEIISLRDAFAKILQKLLDRVKNLNDPRLRDPLTLSLFGVKTARDTFYASPASRNANPAYKGMVLSVLGLLASLAHALSLLLYHGIQPFYDKLYDMQKEFESHKGKLPKVKADLLSNRDFQELMTRLRVLVDNPNTVGHPKLDRAASLIIEHFIKMEDQKQDTRVMVFAQFRSSAGELVKQLRKQEPIVKPTIFVGQASDSRGGSGMKQKEQLEVYLLKKSINVR
jgi:ATP-dependent DNA helicase MPH1